MQSPTPGKVLSFSDANELVRAHAQRLMETHPSAETVALQDALGRVLADPVRADRHQPPFARSMRDGFACRAADVATGTPLTVLGMIRAGYSGAALTVNAGQAVEIMTGAPVPDGADCVVMIEHVQREGSTIRPAADHPIAAGAHIVPMGAEARSGSILLERGTRIGPAHIGAAASCGAAHLCVYSRPRVAIVATGDELVEVGEQPLLHQIRNSNSYGLAAQVVAAGAHPVRLPIARDEAGHLEGVIRSALDADLVLLSGGVSMGKYDLVEDVLLSLGAEFFFTGALIQPGKPVVFGKLPFAGREVYFFGLPGNPVSTMVTFSLFVEPLLCALGGEPDRAPRFAQARLAREVSVKAGLTRFLPARIQATGMDVTVDRIAWQGSGDLASTSRANCFLVIPADRSVLSAGETVTVLLA